MAINPSKKSAAFLGTALLTLRFTMLLVLLNASTFNAPLYTKAAFSIGIATILNPLPTGLIKLKKGVF